MSKSYTLKAEKRERVGKGSSRELRRNGLIPAVIYGEKQPPLAITVPYKEIFYKIHAGGFRTTIATIVLDKQKIMVLPKDYQLDPVRDFPLHVDFLRISAKSVVEVNIPVHFLNEDTAPGLKKGGVLNIVRHEIECTAPANAIPEAIEIDLSSYSIGDSIHISAVQLPKDVTPIIQDRDFTIATIAAPASLDVSDETSEQEKDEGETQTS
ncbi:50S ribosomal protein L25/general stress protein Ctc [Bartonella tribocorum]|uniref:Large ribosomal subunit protein bL25 n=1 Tax=Bartonella tribocorum (strain DSM 28219 / CCUG 45778 / CIP 105476 / IBS 506) TaxID=382640 RepID=RL25_BART1|nr:50S ribosomal protein L25/general stress protein Ctc [Bartonella tribocorum]A9IR85.1 RecName: Full=Large ribosomal subunit protein bL25; AltName: Full=50S ribosomal protein L25; AltName: Full=General stress protein CTC [Bartonella tribocorum CIP 105476]CAK01150.1 50S ribosomal protein L25 [Bartonella tribocorum CIP 105476]CDO48366.1 50S ribosomal protein L25/general stress protein Ctc [Bartonella tribocorum]